MRVRFIIDSASDMTQKEAEALDVGYAPMQITFGTTVYQDGIDLSHTEFFHKLAESDVLPVTSQVNPATYEALYKSLTADGSQVVVITLSAKLSGTYQSARIATEDFSEKVFVVDSLSATVGQRLLLERGLALAEQGLAGKQIAQRLEEEKKKLRLVATVDTLEYLRKGGRISGAVALAGGLLGIKPIVSIENGEVTLVGKARGAKQAATLLRQLVENAGTIDRKKPVALAYAATDATLQQFMDMAKHLWQGGDVPPVYTLGCTIGTHVGPGAYGIAFFIK